MEPVTPPPMTRQEAQTGLVHHMLTEPGRDQATELVIINRQVYRITAERVPIEDIPEAARQFLEDHPDAQQ